MDYDLRTASFEEFLDFLFDHPVATEIREELSGISVMTGEERWFHGIGFPGKPKVRHSPDLTADHYIALFEDPEILRDRHSSGQIAQGFDLIAGSIQTGFDAGLGRVLADRSIGLEKRLRLARALYPLHDRLFVQEDLINVAGRLWMGRGIAISVHQARKAETDATDLAQLKGALFAVLCRLLEHPEARFVVAAIIGLEGIEHWKTPVALRECLNSRDDLGAETRKHMRFLIDCFDKLYLKWPIYH